MDKIPGCYISENREHKSIVWLRVNQLLFSYSVPCLFMIILKLTLALLIHENSVATFGTAILISLFDNDTGMCAVMTMRYKSGKGLRRGKLHVRKYTLLKLDNVVNI